MNHNPSLLLPPLSQMKERRVYAQIRPHREGGIRLETHSVEGKNILYNFGHGGAGISLAHGSAARGTALVSDWLKDGDSLAVVGSGIVGLTLALQVKRVYPRSRVTVYAERFPRKHQLDNAKLIASSVAPGYWLPYSYGREHDSQHFQMAQNSYDRLKELMKDPRFARIVSYCQVYDMNDSEELAFLQSILLPEQLQSLRVIDVNLRLSGSTQGSMRKCKHFKTIKIDLPAFLSALVHQAEQEGILFMHHYFESLANVLQIPDRNIALCCGFGSKKITEDRAMIPLKGHLIEFENPNSDVFHYIFKMNTPKGVVSVYCHLDRILLGLTREENDTCTIEEQKLLSLRQKWKEVEGIFQAKL